MAADPSDAPLLQIGSAGAAVAALQTDLSRAGCAPGPCDGHFGARTHVALARFQAAHGLPADGIAGARTLRLLDDAAVTLTVADVQRMFPGTPQAPIARNLPAILASLAAAGLAAPRMTLTALATIRAEAECFEPVEEQVDTFNTRPGGRPFDLYDGRGELGNLGAPDGATFRGRGYVQLTGRGNYLHFGRAIGVALVEAPGLACEPTIAARLLAAFLCAREREIGAALDRGDLARARRAVNGGTHGLARFEAAYREGEARQAALSEKRTQKLLSVG